MVAAETREAIIKRLLQQQEILYALSQRSLATFTQRAWHVLEPNTVLKWNWHLDLICEHLEAVARGQIRRLIINIPPRNLKSTLVSVCWPAWCWIQENIEGNPLVGPSARFITTSYSQKLSTRHSVNCRNLVQSPWYGDGWGDRVQLSEDTNRQDEFSTTARGHRIATSMGGSATGSGGNCLIIDDPHDTTSAGSDLQRATDLEDYDLKFTSRLDDKKLGAIVIVMQRLHVADLTGHVMTKDPGGWVHVRLPAEAEGIEVPNPAKPSETIRVPEKLVFPITRRWVQRSPGDILHPDKEGPLELAQAKRDQGSMGYAGQYQQRPVSLEGGVFKRGWWKYMPLAAMTAVKKDMEIQSWDFAVKDKVGNDFVVGLVVARRGADRYVLDMVRDRMDFPASCNALVMLTRKHRSTHKKVIEAKANGPAVIATLKKVITGLVEMEPQGDKMQRANAIAPDVEAGNWHLPNDAHWVSDFVTELCAFPKGANDDIVDAFTQGAIVLRSTATPAMPILGHGTGFVHR